VDFKFTREQEEFRRDINRLLDEELPPNWAGYIGPTVSDSGADTEEGWQIFKHMAHKFGEMGWLSLTWPKEYGGQARSHVHWVIFMEEVARRGSPGINLPSIGIAGPAIIEFGSEEQKKNHLLPIARGNEFWCECFSEPDAGSDLGSLRTRATRDNNNYIINGQKTWITFAQCADWSLVLVRTDPLARGFRGLSLFMVDMHTPGIVVNPIRNILGEVDFNEVFFEDVKVPARNLLGEENNGWYVTQVALARERATIHRVAVVKRLAEELAKYVKSIAGKGQTDNKFYLIRHTLAQIAIEAEIGRLLCCRLAWEQDVGIDTEWGAAMFRQYSTELLKRTATTAMQLMGLPGLLDKTDVRAPGRGWIQHLYLSSRAATIAAGTTEIQKNIIARRGLGLH
jgi:alkylation response protein AidB-like acyl-CoA dehydrogenase